MVESALLGDPPATVRDTLIAKALRLYRTNFSGNPKLPFGPPRPKPPKPDLAWESNAWRTETAAAVFFSLIILVTIGRFGFWWRKRKTWALGKDDVLVICAAIVAAVYVGHILSAFPEGTCLGKHMWFCHYEHIERLYLTFTIGQTIFYFSVYCSKLSLLFFIQRLTRASRSRTYDTIHRGLFCLLLSCGLISLFGTAFQCTPVTSRWSLVTLGELDPKDYKCLDTLKFQTALRAMHISTDLLLLMYPAYILRELQMPLTKKVGISAVFCFGIFSVICSIVRNIIFGKKRPDYTYMAHDVYIWNMADITSACIVPSLPAYYPLFNTLYRGVCGMLSIPASIRSAAKNYSTSSRSKRSALSSSRHHPKTPHLEDVYGPYSMSDDKSTGSGNLGLAGTAERPGAVTPGSYVLRKPQLLSRDGIRVKREIEVRQEDIELGERHP